MTPQNKKHDRFFWMDGRLFEGRCEYVDAGGDTMAIVAFCHTPKEGEFKWWNIQLLPGEQIDYVTVH